MAAPESSRTKKGLVTRRKDYTAFGEEIITSQRTSPNRTDYTDLDEIRQGYTGYEKDTESGLEYAQARYYNTRHGRFTSVDPLTASAEIRNPQTFNRYSYVLNSPYKFTDPLGLLPVTVACGGWCPNSGPSVDGSAFSGQDASLDWTKQQAEPPPPPPVAGQNTGSGDFVFTSSYSYTATRTSGDIITEVVINVTETITVTIGSDAPARMQVDVKVDNGPNANNLLTTAQLNTIGETVGETIASAFSKKFDKTLALAIMEKETFYGTIGARSDKAYNPGQYTSGIGDGRTMSTDKTNAGRRHNIDLALDLYKQKEGELKTNDPLKVLESYRGKGYEPTYNTQVIGISNGIKNGIKASEKGSLYITPFKYYPRPF